MASKKSVIAVVLGLTLTTTTGATDLVTVYQQAAEYDSELAAAFAGFKAQEERVDEAQSTLLPQIGAAATLQRTRYLGDPGFDIESSFTSKGWGISLVQPLFRADRWYRFQGSKYASERAQAEFAQEQQELILRTAEAYFSVLRTKEALTTSLAAEEAFERQWQQAVQRHKVGLTAVTEVHESRALYDAAKVQRIALEGEVDLALENLERLTGKTYPELASLSEQFPVFRPVPNEPDAWVETALKQNWAIQTAFHGVQVAQEQAKAARALHYPTLDATASYNRSSSSSSGPGVDRFGQNYTAFGVELTVPLYAGGGIDAGVRRARYELEQAEQVLTTIRRNVTLNTRSLFRAINTNIESISARKQAIVSAESALSATRAGYKVGTRNVVEVLDAERLYYETLRDYTNDRFNYVLNSLRLKQAAGTLSPEDLMQLNRWLARSEG